MEKSLNIGPGKPIRDYSLYKTSKGEDIAWYGLPREISFCVECNMSNQQPMSCNEYKHGADAEKVTMSFDESGLCNACRFNKMKSDGTIDWKEREAQLIDLCNRYRKTDGSYDCLVGGSGGKDSAFQAHVLKYKYKMNPLTVTWSPHLYTDIGWKNFQNWIHVGGFDNYLHTPNGKIHRLLTRNATINMLHPFQPFILGQKTFADKMAVRFNIPLIFYGEMPGEYGEKISHNTNRYAESDKVESEGFVLNPTDGMNFDDILLGGVSVAEYLDSGVALVDLMPYLPMDPNIIHEKRIEKHYLGYYLKWIPQEVYYYAVEHTGFQANPVRTEGTYSKYNSLDDKTDGFFYYTRYIKFGVGRTMMDSAQEIRNRHISKEEGIALMRKFEGEYPSRYEKEFLDYISMTKEDFMELCDRFRSPHLWRLDDSGWHLRKTPY
jgi:N-acetyl sugar amidotransferase